MSHGKTLESGIGAEPCHADVADDPVLEISQVLILRFRLFFRFGVKSPEKVAIEERDVDVKARCGVPRRKSVLAERD